jgi:hypothetical protein
MERSTYDKILEQNKKDLDTHVSSSSSIQKYAILFTLILRLRMFCDQGHCCKGFSSPPYPVDVSGAWFPTEFEIGDYLGCDSCRNEESLDLMKDLAFCPSCSRVLPYQNSKDASDLSKDLSPSTLCTPQSSYPSNKPAGFISSLPRSQQSLLQVDMSAKEYSTKLAAVAKTLRDNIRDSKRSVNH